MQTLVAVTLLAIGLAPYEKDDLLKWQLVQKSSLKDEKHVGGLSKQNKSDISNIQLHEKEETRHV